MNGTVRPVSFFGAFVAYGALWWLFTGGQEDSWIIGIPTVFAAALLHQAIRPPQGRSPHLIGVLRFIPFFIWMSLRGGIDVAWRVLRPSTLSPVLIRLPLRLPPGTPQIIMMTTISLLPGTLSVELLQGEVEIHVLVSGGAFREEFARVEHRVGALFGLPLKELSHG